LLQHAALNLILHALDTEALLPEELILVKFDGTVNQGLQEALVRTAT
jgi:hypothetical protein